MNKKLAFLGSTLILASGLVANQPAQILKIPGNSWQLFGFNQEVDLDKTFIGTSVKIVWAWDNHKGDWVSYSPQYAMKMALKEQNLTFVDTLKPNQGFWVQSYDDVNVTVQEVFYPLYDMCVNVNSDLYWSNATDENNIALTTPYMQCENFLATLPSFAITESALTVTNSSEVKGYFKTNMPVVFAKNINTNLMVKVSDIQDADLVNYMELNGSISNISLNSISDDTNDFELTDFNFTLDNSSNTNKFFTMFISNSNNVEKVVELKIAFPNQ